MSIDQIIEIIKSTILITGLVITMMLIIEFLNVKSKGKIFDKLKGSKIKQVITAACLGLIPGCIGGFAVVSLYTHKLLSFGALVAMMICSSGDEAFVMLAVIPETALILFGVLFVIAIITGIMVDKFYKPKGKVACDEDYEIHNEEKNVFPSIFKLSSYKKLRNASRERIILLTSIGLFAFGIISGALGCNHDHTPQTLGTTEIIGTPETLGILETTEIIGTDHAHTQACAHSHGQVHAHSLNLLDEQWMIVVYAVICIITMLFLAVSDEHFIKDHIWNHVIKHHLLSVFLWTLGALLVLHLGINNLNMESIIQDNMVLMIIFAVLIGIIPESGPHLFFITLFSGGLIPFSVLIANSIVQDGHTTLPLLAESKKTFFRAKLINIAVGLIVGLALYYIGY